MKARVKWPGKDWDNKPEYGGGQRTSATFEIRNGEGRVEEVKVNCSKPDSPKGVFLKSLKKGEIIELEYNRERGDIPAFYDIDTWAVIDSLKHPSEPADDDTNEERRRKALDKAQKRSKYFFGVGIALAREVALEANLEPSDDALFERAGALGTSLWMDLKNDPDFK